MLQKQKTNVFFNKKANQKIRIAIIRTDYYKELINNLEDYCINTLKQHGVKGNNIKVLIAPGSWEIPLLTQAAAKSKKFDAIITLGIIVKGETYHFDMIANECARALMRLSLDYSIPIAIEVLAVNTLKQAEARAGNNDKNKGIEGAIAVLKMVTTLDKFNNE